MRQFLAENCPGAKKEWDWRASSDEPKQLVDTCKHLETTLLEPSVPPAQT
jgi:hypothetical protein